MRTKSIGRSAKRAPQRADRKIVFLRFRKIVMPPKSSVPKRKDFPFSIETDLQEKELPAYKYGMHGKIQLNRPLSRIKPSKQSFHDFDMFLKNL